MQQIDRGISYKRTEEENENHGKKIMLYIRQIEGGAGSGNFGHAGRKGLRGGSASTAYGKISLPTNEEFREHLVTLNESFVSFKDTLNKKLAENLGIPEVNSLSHVDVKYTKALVCKNLSEQTGIPEEKVSEVLRQWAISSNDTSYASLAIQEAISKEFNVKLSPFQKKQLAYTMQKRQELLDYAEGDAKFAYFLSTDPNLLKASIAKYKPNASDAELHAIQVYIYKSEYRGQMEILPEADTRKLVRAMYDSTQKMFADAGVTHVLLSRGVKDVLDTPFSNKRETVAWNGNAAESWTSRLLITRNFSDSVLTAKVPVSRIFSTPLTGMGCLQESEHILLGGGGTAVAFNSRWDFTDEVFD